jgi:antitoxin (DNA-binding transcriptional repressor) of toxin-antitoxin stability system
MYGVKKYKVAMVRERLSQALDQAESGEPVFIERNGVTYRLSVERPPARRPGIRQPGMEILDPTVAGGDWTWQPAGPEGAPGNEWQFTPRRAR